MIICGIFYNVGVYTVYTAGVYTVYTAGEYTVYRYIISGTHDCIVVCVLPNFELPCPFRTIRASTLVLTG